MGKNIRVYISTIGNNLKDYHKNLLQIISEIKEHEEVSKWKPDWLYIKLSNEIKGLRNYLNMSNATIDRIPDSKKTLASAKRKLSSILEYIKIEEPELECLAQAKILVKELEKINL